MVEGVVRWDAGGYEQSENDRTLAFWCILSRVCVVCVLSMNPQPLFSRTGPQVHRHHRHVCVRLLPRREAQGMRLQPDAVRRMPPTARCVPSQVMRHAGSSKCSRRYQQVSFAIHSATVNPLHFHSSRTFPSVVRGCHIVPHVSCPRAP